MRILFVAPRFHTNQFAITKYLVQNGHEVLFLVSRRGETEDYSYINPIVCKENWIYKRYENFKFPNSSISKENFRIGHFIPSFRFLLSKMKTFKPDIVISRDRTFFTIITLFVAFLCSVKCKLLYVQSPLYRDYRSFFSKLVFSLFNLIVPFDGVITPVKYKNSTIKKNEVYKEKKYYFVPLVVDEKQSIESRTYFNSSKINILDVGKYRSYKNHYVLIDALTLLRKDILSNVHVTIAGQAVCREEEIYYTNLQKYIKAKGLDKIVTLKCNLPFNAMEYEYLSNDIFILTSKLELCSVAVVEAMSYGLYTISTSMNGTATYVKDAAGAIFTSEDPHNLADILNDVCSSKSKITNGGFNAYTISKENYSPAAYWNLILSIYNKEPIEL